MKVLKRLLKKLPFSNSLELFEFTLRWFTVDEKDKQQESVRNTKIQCAAAQMIGIFLEVLNTEKKFVKKFLEFVPIMDEFLKSGKSEKSDTDTSGMMKGLEEMS